MTVKVTAEDIRNGKRCAARSCPVALAMTRALGRPVSIALGSWRWVNVDMWLGELPVEVRDWIRDFDSDYTHRSPTPRLPFSFDIDLPAS